MATFVSLYLVSLLCTRLHGAHGHLYLLLAGWLTGLQNAGGLLNDGTRRIAFAGSSAPVPLGLPSSVLMRFPLGGSMGTTNGNPTSCARYGPQAAYHCKLFSHHAQDGWLTGRKLRTHHDSEQLRRLRVKVYADQMTSQAQSPSGDTGAMVFATDFQFTDVYPMFSVNNGEECGHTLKEFIQNVGIPEQLVTDYNKSFIGRGTDWYATCRDKCIKQANTEPYSHWHNKAEAAIRELKRLYKKISHGLPIPRKYWFYLLRYCSDIRNRTALNIYSLEGKTPYEKLHGEVPDIGPWLKFKYGEPVFFNFQKATQHSRDFPPDDTKQIGRWLGVYRHDAATRTFYILTKEKGSAAVLTRSDVIPWTAEEKKNPEFIRQLAQFDAAIMRNDNNDSLTDNEQWAIDFLQSSDDLGYSPADRENTDPTAVDLSDETINNEALFASSPAMKAPFDEHVGSLLKIPYGEEVAVVEVLDRKRTPHIDSRLVEKHDNSPLDNRRYSVRMPNSEIREYTANLIAENLFAQCDEDGTYRVLFDEIIDHKHDETAIPIGKDTYFDKRYGKNLPIQNFQGWFLCVRWKDDSLSWVPLKHMYESEILKTAEYAVMNKLTDWPAFKWWVDDALL